MGTNPPDGSGVGSLTPAGMLRAAVKTVPAMRYAVGVGALASVVAIVLLGWKLKAQDAIFGSLIVLVLMVVLVVFAALAGMGGATLHLPALFLAWSCTSLTVGVAILFVSCAFFDKPKTLPCLLQNDCRTLSGTLTPTSPSCTIVAGASSCNVSLTWSTSYPVDLSAVTSNYPHANWTVAVGNAGGPITVPVPYSGRRFYVYNNQQLLATSVATCSCASGTAWSGSKCQTSATSDILMPGQRVRVACRVTPSYFGRTNTASDIHKGLSVWDHPAHPEDCQGVQHAQVADDTTLG
jgi:hypothetical protein